MPLTKYEEFSGEPLSPLENQKARKIIRDQERMDWLWASARIWVGWGTAGVAGIYAGWDIIVRVVKALVALPK